MAVIEIGLKGNQHVRRIPPKESVYAQMEMKSLFKLWERAHKDEPDADYIRGTVPQTSFLPDGIIDEEKYILRKEKVLFIAKEAYWFSPEDSKEESIENAKGTMFWHREVAFGKVPETIFSKRLSMLANAIFTGNYYTINKDHRVLQDVAVLNLNKRGGFSYCVWNTLETYVHRYRDFISREIQMIAPTLIVCCGNGVRWLLDKYIDLPKNIKVITVSHPSYFALSDAEYLRQLECSVQEHPWIPRKKEKIDGNSSSDKKGIIFDTNKTYSEDATFDMLTSGKISAYGEASRFVNSFSMGDYAFYYIKGRGIVAVGEILSDLAITSEYEGNKEAYKMVRMIVPDIIPSVECELCAISPARLKEIVGHGFYFASTVKKPYLSEAECHNLIDELKTIYMK